MNIIFFKIIILVSIIFLMKLVILSERNVHLEMYIFNECLIF